MLEITRLPDFSMVRALLHNPWTAVETQSGQLRHQSAIYPGAWSVSSLLVRAATEVLVYAEVYDKAKGEQFHLRFASAADEWCASHLRSSRPSFAAVSQWPIDLSLASELLKTGPEEAEIGLGPPIEVTGAVEEEFIPIFWCCFSVGRRKIMMYADNEIPLNVALVQISSDSNQIKNALNAALIIKL